MSSAALVLAGASACLGLGATAAYAEAPVDRGWWTATNPGSPAPAQAPPDVPADGLLVQGGPDSPAALAGLIYEPEAGATAEQLVLKVVSPSATTPGAVLQLCPLTAPALNAEQGGPIADAPAYDCSRKVTAAPDADGAGYTFKVGALVSSGPFAVAVLPTAPTDRVVLAKPAADSLVTSSPMPDFSPEPFPSEPAPAPLVPGTAAESPSFGAAGPPPVLPAVTPGPQAPTVAEASSDAPSASAVSTVDVAATSREHHVALGVGLLAVLAAGCGLWAFAGRGPGLDETLSAD